MRTTRARCVFYSSLAFLTFHIACRDTTTIPTFPSPADGFGVMQSSTTSSDFIVARLASFSEDSSSVIWYDSDSTRSAYFVERRDADSAQFVTLAVLGPWMREYLDGGRRQILHTYSYRVAAVKGTSEKKYSNILTMYLNPRRPLSVRPIHESASSVTLQWNFTGNISEGFLVERSRDGVGYTNIGSSPRNRLEYTDNNLDTTQVYFYRVFTLTKYDTGPSSIPIKVGYVFNPMYQKRIWMQVLLGDKVPGLRNAND